MVRTCHSSRPGYRQGSELLVVRGQILTCRRQRGDHELLRHRSVGRPHSVIALAVRLECPRCRPSGPSHNVTTVSRSADRPAAGGPERRRAPHHRVVEPGHPLHQRQLLGHDLAQHVTHPGIAHRNRLPTERACSRARGVPPWIVRSYYGRHAVGSLPTPGRRNPRGDINSPARAGTSTPHRRPAPWDGTAAQVTALGGDP